MAKAEKYEQLFKKNEKHRTYTTPHTLTTPHGNNTFSYTQRKKELGTATITIPSLITGTLDDLAIATHTTFEEIDHKNHIQTCHGLQHFIQLTNTHCPTYIIDNHNHALYFRLQHLQQAALHKSTDISLIHVDQHSDLTPNPYRPPRANLATRRRYTNYDCNVGNFISPFLDTFPQADFTRIKSETQLLDSPSLRRRVAGTQGKSGGFTKSAKKIIIVDIDLDFRAPAMSIQNHTATIHATKQLIQHADLITIATSPYFLDQHIAFDLLHQLLD